MNKTIRNEKRVTRNGFREPARRTKKQSLVLGDVPNGWANQQLMSWRNDIDGKQWVEELKTAIANLREQGCGDPNFIYAPGFLVVTRKQIREGLEVLDGSRKVKRELLNSLKWGMTGEPNINMNRDTDLLGADVVGAHAVFDTREPVQSTQDIWTTRPYLRIDIRLNIPLDCGDEWDGSQTVRVDIPSSVVFPELKEIAA